MIKNVYDLKLVMSQLSLYFLQNNFMTIRIRKLNQELVLHISLNIYILLLRNTTHEMNQI